MEPISLTDVISQISIGLDAVEAELLGARPLHSKRVAVFSIQIGKILGYEKERLLCLGSCALLHDNALTEYILSEQPNQNQGYNLKTHCIIGQDNCRCIPFPNKIDGVILYHHERADGKGVFGKKEGEYPEEAGIIALADQTDVRFFLQDLTEDKLEKIQRYIAEGSGNAFSRNIAEAALEVLRTGLTEKMKADIISDTLKEELPQVTAQVSNEELVNLSRITAKIIDYKSQFTQEHSSQIANKAWYMGGIYGYDETLRSCLYHAAAVHDIGKLFIPTEILEKPGKLTKEEFQIIQSHVRYTWEILHAIKGYEQLAAWASNHHEKLDGSGYPFGKKAEELDFNSRLMACLDIYQAVRESRPYHPGRTHEQTMEILYDMSGKGLIDAQITGDLDRELRKLENGFAPPPDLLYSCTVSPSSI